MALTNFAALTAEQKTAWARDLWKAARAQSFLYKWAGTSHDAMVHRITELTKNEKGARAVITLLADLVGDGIEGDKTLEGNEEAMFTREQVIRIDQLRNANRLAGRVADQKSIVDFRKASKDVLAHWIADRLDQLAFLTLSGVSYDNANGGGARPSATLAGLEFAADVSAPTSKRHVQIDANGNLVEGAATTAIDGSQALSYKGIVNLKAFAKDNYIRGCRDGKGNEFYRMFVTPSGMAQLKLDQDFITNVRHAGVRGSSSDLFKGTDSVMVDGVVVSEFHHVYNTRGAAAGSKWGAAGNNDGQRSLFCGAQALGLADLGNPYWNEKEFDYDNQKGISVGKILGLMKPKFQCKVSGDVQDFGVIAVDTAL